MSPGQINALGIIGAGQMGAGIAQVAAQSGIDVVLVDAQRDWAEKGKKKIDGALDKLVQKGKLKPAFQKDGTVTAGNSSTINDGAAAIIVCGADVAEKRGWKPLAKIRAMAQAAQAPEWFTTAPAVSIDRALAKAKLSRGEIDLYEINEAFAVVAIANNQLLELDPKKVNVHGGAVALGHPIGASGARILTTLIHALKHEGKKRGVAAICIGGGEATAMLVEAV